MSPCCAPLPQAPRGCQSRAWRPRRRRLVGASADEQLVEHRSRAQPSIRPQRVIRYLTDTLPTHTSNTSDIHRSP